MTDIPVALPQQMPCKQAAQMQAGGTQEENPQFKALLEGLTRQSAVRPSEKPLADEEEQVQPLIGGLFVQDWQAGREEQIVDFQPIVSDVFGNIYSVQGDSVLADENGKMHLQVAEGNVFEAGEDTGNLIFFPQMPEDAQNLVVDGDLPRNHSGTQGLAFEHLTGFEAGERVEQPQEKPGFNVQQQESQMQQLSVKPALKQEVTPAMQHERRPVDDSTQKPPEAVTVARPVMERPASPVSAHDGLNVQKSDFAEAFSGVVAEKTGAGAKQFEISLYPKELGKVTVNVEIQAGKAVLSLICENPKAQAILNAHAGEIGTLVEQNTGRTVEVIVPQAENDMQQEDFEGRGESQREQSRRNKQPEPEQVDFFIDQLKSSMIVG